MGLDHLQEEQQATVLRIRKRVIEAIGRNMDLYGVTLSTDTYMDCFLQTNQ